MAQLDVTIHNEGSLMLFELHSDGVREWFDFNVATDPWQWLGPNIAVDQRFAVDLADELISDGFTVA